MLFGKTERGLARGEIRQISAAAAEQFSKAAVAIAAWAFAHILAAHLAVAAARFFTSMIAARLRRMRIACDFYGMMVVGMVIAHRDSGIRSIVMHGGMRSGGHNGRKDQCHRHQYADPFSHTVINDIF